MNTSNEIVAVLHNLIENCKDGSKGYYTAAKDVEDPQLKTMFRDYSVQRDGMITQLQNELHKFGKMDSEKGSVGGAINRGWINLTSALTSKNSEKILAECERGEDAAVEAYEKAIKADLPSNIHQIIEQQYQQVKQAHDKIRGMRDQAK